MFATAASAQVLPPPPTSVAPVVKYEYDAQGNPKRTILAPDVANYATTTNYDRLNRLKNITDAKSGSTDLDYNGREDLIQVTDPRRLVTSIPRNGLGDATGLISPDTGAASHTYDAAGNLLTRRDSRGVLASYSYDALNRPASLVYSSTGQRTTVNYAWAYDQVGSGFSNGVGRLTSASYPTGSARHAYDAQGRLVSVSQDTRPSTNAPASTTSWDTVTTRPGTSPASLTRQGELSASGTQGACPTTSAWPQTDRLLVNI
jgi:YD repeat-containing protein